MNHTKTEVSLHQDDEIDLRELFIALWRGKIIIVVTTFLFAAIAVIYALNAQEQWSSKAVVSQPRIQDIAAYRQQVKVLESAYDFNGSSSPEQIFAEFVAAFNDTENKKRFFNVNKAFIEFKQKYMQEHKDSDNAVVMQRFYNEWYEKISAVPEKDNPKVYTLSLQARSSEESYQLLRQYVEFIEQKVMQDLIGDLKVTLNMKRAQLEKQYSILTTEAKLRLDVELKKTQYAYEIAKAAAIDTPVENLTYDGFFSIGMGAKALQAKVKALKGVKSLEVVEPELLTLSSRLDLIKAVEFDEDVELKPYHFIRAIEAPINRDEPKRALIAVLGTLFGGMLGVGIVLIRFAFTRNETEEK